MKLKKNTKKGFTIVELVIVIAVIAILAAVLIPTFSGLVEKANQSSAMQEARNAYERWLATDKNAQGDFATYDFTIQVTKGSTNYYFTVTDGQFNATGTTTAPVESEVKGTVSDGVLTVAPPTSSVR